MRNIPFFGLAISFGLGIAAARFQAFPLPATCFLGFILLLVLWNLRGRQYFVWILCLLLFLLGILHAAIAERKIQNSLTDFQAKFQTSQRVTIYGKIDSEPEIKIYQKKRTLSFLMKTHKIIIWKNRERKVISWMGRLQIFYHQPVKKLFPGDEVRASGMLEPLSGPKNPGEFDYRQYLLDRDVCGLFSVYGDQSLRVLKSAPFFSPAKILSRVRSKIRERISRFFNPEEALFVRALLLGDRKNLSREWKNRFFKTGTSHLLAISGLHIAMVVGSFYLLLILCGISQKKAAFAGLLATVVQVAIAGFGIPVVRAGIMAGLTFLALMQEREKNGGNLFFLAFLTLLMADPRNLWQISFQLSFLSLFCLIVFSSYWNGRWPWLEALASGAAVLAGSFPIVIYHFNTFSTSGLLVNLFAIPLFHMVQLTSLLATSAGDFPWLGFWLVLACKLFLKITLAWIAWMAQADWGYFFLPRFKIWQMILYYLFLAGFLLSWKLSGKKRWILGISCLGLWMSLVTSLFVEKPQQHFEVTFFSAGSNDMAHIQFSSKNHWLVNAGRSLPGDQAEWILSPYLKSKGIKHLKGILFTDNLKRHTAGFETLSRDFHFDYRISPQQPKQTSILKERTHELHAGDRIWMPEDAFIEILANKKGRFLFFLKTSDRKILYLPEISYPVFQILSKRREKADMLVLPSLKNQNAPLLKSILTVTGTPAVVSPRLSSEAIEIFHERNILFFDLSKQGALCGKMNQVSKQFEWESFSQQPIRISSV